MDFRFKKGELRTITATKASATVIEAGDLVAIDTGLIIKAVAASTALAYAPWGAGDGETEIEVTLGNDFYLEGTGDAVFAVSQKGTEVDLVGTTTQLIDVGTSTTDVLKIGISDDAGTVDSTTNIEVRINKPIY